MVKGEQSQVIVNLKNTVMGGQRKISKEVKTTTPANKGARTILKTSKDHPWGQGRTRGRALHGPPNTKGEKLSQGRQSPKKWKLGHMNTGVKVVDGFLVCFPDKHISLRPAYRGDTRAAPISFRKSLKLGPLILKKKNGRLF